MARTRQPSAAGPLPSDGFPSLSLPLPIPYPAMEALRVAEIPSGSGWLYEPKWDGFRCLLFRDHDHVALQSKAGQPLTRYFPELVQAVLALPVAQVILDGEIVVAEEGSLSFDALLLRIHPAASRVARLAAESPARFLAFDLLAEGSTALTAWPLAERRPRLEARFDAWPPGGLIRLSPATQEHRVARQWFEREGAQGLDGVIAKRLDDRYRSGERAGMVKVKRFKTAECVVGGFRYGADGQVGSLLLGLYDARGQLAFVGHTASFSRRQRAELTPLVEGYRGASAFTGRVPGGPSRWAKKAPAEWISLRPELVCEVRYDYFSQGRFRHGATFLRWRPDKPASHCTMDQVLPSASGAGDATLRRVLA